MQSHNGSKAMMSFVGYSKGKALFYLRILCFSCLVYFWIRRRHFDSRITASAKGKIHLAVKGG